MTTISRSEASTRGTLDALADEHRAWHEMPFIDTNENGEIVSHWNPADVTKTNQAGEQEGNLERCAIGAHYALYLINHMRQYGGEFMDGGWFSTVVKAIVERGEWTGVEIGFFTAIENWLTCGRVTVSGGFDAVPFQQDAPAGNDTERLAGRA